MAKKKSQTSRSEDSMRVTFSIGLEYKELLEKMAKMERRSATELVRLMVDKRASDMGLNPIGPVLSPPVIEQVGAAAAQ